MLSVSDVSRAVEFYQGLLGMPIQARQGSTVLLRVGAGPQYLGLTPAGSAAPSISHFGLAIENFNPDRVLQVLAEHGVAKAGAYDSGLTGGPMKVRLTTRNGTPEIYMGDPDGLIAQLQDASYCGGSGPLGAVCQSVEPSPKKGVLAVTGLSHATIGVTDAPRTVDFFQKIFGFHVQAHQGAAPVYGVGNSRQFAMFTGGGAGTAPRIARIDHVCLWMTGFDPDSVTKALNSYGIQNRPAGETARQPLRTYISLRTAERGGAPNGTPELYFTDPDGLAIQLQDTSYCGGGGFLGNVCEI